MADRSSIDKRLSYPCTASLCDYLNEAKMASSTRASSVKKVAGINE